MQLTVLPDGTYRLALLKFGDPNKRYWQYDEKGAIVWQAHPEPFYVPRGVSVIGQLRCPMLGEVILSPDVREIDDLAFGAEFYTGDTYEWYALHTIHFSTGLRRIGFRAFYNCRNLNHVHLPKGLTDIEEDAFCICKSLSRITIPASVTYIGPRAFGKNSALEKVRFLDGLRVLCGSVFIDDTNLREVVLPQTLEKLGYACFSGCTSLTKIELPESLAELNGKVFENCTALTSLCFKRDLENSERMRKETPFAGCTALTELRLEHGVTRGDWIPTAPALTAFRVPADHPHLTVEDGALYSKDKKTLLRVPMGRTGEWIVPRGVVEIGAFAFSGCVGITEVVLPSTLRTIAKGAFSGCTSLCSIDFPGKLTDIGACAFADCTALARVHITSGIRHIGENAFAGCAALRALSVSPQNSKYRIDDGKLVSL